MGRIKTRLIKRVSFEIVEKHREELNDNFDDNKKKVEEFATIGSKKLRNTIAGYVTRQLKTNKGG